jgi:hypothetical protein
MKANPVNVFLMGLACFCCENRTGKPAICAFASGFWQQVRLLHNFLLI